MTKKKILTQTSKHEQDRFKGKVDNSEAAKHLYVLRTIYLNSVNERVITEREIYKKD